MKEITSKIVSYEVLKETAGEAVVPEVVQEPVDVNPLTLRIEHRPIGSLEAVSEKVDYVGAEGRKKVYLIVSFMPVTGVVNGEQVTIERPIEFFFPSGQLSSEHQWITATMRSLSLAARGGYITQALTDLRKVAWDKGLVRCGMNKYGKPAFHESEVGAIAWSIQQILQRRGFLDEDGFQVPLEGLIEAYNRRHLLQEGPNSTTEVEAPVEAPAATEETKPETKEESKPASVGLCPECSSDLVLLDGCPTCVEGCGWSKCG